MAIPTLNSKGKPDINEGLVKMAASQSQSRCQTIIVMFMSLAMLVLYLIDRSASNGTDGNVNGLGGRIAAKNSNRIKRTFGGGASGVCSSICVAHREIANKENQDEDFTDVKSIPKILDKAISERMKYLEEQYGKDTFQTMFVKPKEKANETADPRIPYRSFATAQPKTGDSIEKMIRKLQIKIVEAQIAYRDSFKRVDGCDCSDLNKAKAVGKVPDHLDNATEYLELARRNDFSKYVWATGGHSAAAGHGNLFNETYTVFLERAIGPIFNALKIGFEARNYAMGGTSSGPEISMCTRSIFGDDIDALSWDFAMTDGDRHYRILHYIYRAGLHTGKMPAIVCMHSDGGRSTDRRAASMIEGEKLGMSVFRTIGTEFNEILNGVPDVQGLTAEQTAAMPPMVRSFKCSGQIEKGDPGCDAAKYNMWLCPDRRARASWHPGIKHQAVDGNRISLLFMHLLKEAVSNERFQNATSLDSLLADLKAEEEKQRAAFKNAALPESYETLNFQKVPEITNDMLEVMFKNPNICHTARLPAQIRFNGILTEKPDKIGDQAPVGKETYDVGIFQGDADKGKSEDGKMRLVYEYGKARERTCPVTVKPDYKDWFYATHNDGAVSLTLPNKMERDEYGYDPKTVKGMIVACSVMCDWGKCPPGDTNFETLGVENVDVRTVATILVNGQPVTRFYRMEASCAVFANDSGPYFKPNADGLFEISVAMVKPDTYMRFSSIIIY